MRESDHPTEWIRTSADVFWGELAQTDHVLQVYASEQAFLDALTGFVGTGINTGDCVVVIATAAHLNALNEQLKALGVHISGLISDDRYIPLAADKTLDKFMVDGMPDAGQLRGLVEGLLNRARRRGRKARFFGEMVALLWEEGNKNAAIRLEELWTGLSTSESFGIFCAYPEAGFITDKATSIHQLCNCHSKMINGTELQLQQVHYKGLPQLAG